MQLKAEINTYLKLKDEYGNIDNSQITIIAESGWGKGIAGEGIMEEFHKAGYQIICVADPKKEWELAFQMFKPTAEYHLEHLRKIGKIPSKKPVKLYHPFTFKIPTNKFLPDINFYTFSLKDLGREEWSIITESESDTEVMGVLLNSSKTINKEEGLYSFLHTIEQSIKGKKSSGKRKRDPKNFYLESPPGTAKSSSDISRRLQQFKTHYFLTKDNCFSNLDWKELLSDQKNYHVFSTYWIDDEKLDDFVVLSIINGIIRNKEFKKHPILLVIPELSRQCPPNPRGYKIMLSKIIRNALKTIRNIRKGGCSSLSDSQDLTSIDPEVAKSSTEIFFGQVGVDNEKIGKIFNYGRSIKEQLKKMDYRNSFLRVGYEDDPITLFFSSAGHKEQKDDFFDKYKQEYSEKEVRYELLIKKMRKIYEEDENKVKEKIKKIEKQEKEYEESKKKEKEIAKSDNSKNKEKSDKINQKQSKTIEMLMKLCYEMWKDPNIEEKDKSWRKIGKKFDISHLTAKKYALKYEEKEKEKDLLPKINGVVEND